MERVELLQSKEYWLAKFQIELFNHVQNYLNDNKLTRTDLAKILGVTKGYVSQVLNGDADHRISKIIELALSIGYVPDIQFKSIEEYLSTDAKSDEELKSEEIERCTRILQEVGYMIARRADKNSECDSNLVSTKGWSILQENIEENNHKLAS